MNGIFKRQKAAAFAQIGNEGLQTLEDIRSIGVLGHLMSLPENWVVQKMQLYKKFGKAAIEKAITELEQKNYWVTIKYRKGSRNYYNYTVSDIPFSDDEVMELIEKIREAELDIMEISEGFQHLLHMNIKAQINKEESVVIEETEVSVESRNSPNLTKHHSPLEADEYFVQTKMDREQSNPKDTYPCPPSTTDFEQLNVNDSTSIIENRQLVKKEGKIDKQQINNQQRNLVNLQKKTPKLVTKEDFKQALTNACHDYYQPYSIGRWNKKAWTILIDAFVNETIQSGRYKNIQPIHLHRYALASIQNMVCKFDQRNGKVMVEKPIPGRPVPFYNWLEVER